VDTSDVYGRAADFDTAFAEALQVDETELEIASWRLHQFTELGFDLLEALELTTGTADLAQARKLIRGGCPLPTALRILH
jgi:hypothetical protein